MKKNILLAVTCLFTTISTYSQDWPWPGYREGELYPGYIIKTDGTQIEGYLQAQSIGDVSDAPPIWSSNQTKVIFYSDPKNKKTKVTYKPDDIKEYKLADKVYRSINYSGGLAAKPLRFVLLTQDGRIAQYTWYDNIGNNTYPKYEAKLILQKGNEKPFEAGKIILTGFAKKMSELVSDYPELSAKIANKEKGYGATNIYDIINEYNTWYENQQNK